MTPPTVKKITIDSKYAIEIPADFVVHEIPSSPVTSVPMVILETPDGASIDIAVHPYRVSPSPIPGKCVVSTDFDAGLTSAPVFCEGLIVTSTFMTGSWDVSYGSRSIDLASSLNCTMNTPCPIDISPGLRYSILYVFVVPDRSHDTLLEFYAGDAFRSPTNEIDGFQGLGAVLQAEIIPTLTLLNP